MAREHARILTRIWSDRDWRELPAEPQRLYFLLLSQGNVTQAGVLPLQVRKWAKGSAYTSEEDVQKALDTLVAERFVVVDEDTEEVLIRSFIRNDGVAKIPNVFKAALRAALAVESPKLREVLAAELRRTRRKEAGEVADELSPMDSQTVPEPIPNQSGTVDRTNGEPLKDRERMPEPPGVGEGEGEGEPLVGGWVGEGASAREPDDHPAASPAPENLEGFGPRPADRCPKHRDIDEPPPCGQCADARRAAEAWDVEQPRREALARSAEARRRAELRATAIAACNLCDDHGYVGTRLCDHDPQGAERAARGRAAVDAALNRRETS